MEGLDITVGAVDVNALVLWVYEETELSAVGDVLLHLGLENGESVGVGAEFDYEVGAYVE